VSIAERIKSPKRKWNENGGGRERGSGIRVVKGESVERGQAGYSFK
jgi:hypothetical protein